MKNMKNAGSMIVTAVASIFIFAGSALSAESATDFGTETRNLIIRSIEANINNVAAGNVSGQPMIREIQNSMMTKISNTIKQNTAARKRATVVKTCMECRAMQPIKVVVSGQSSFLSADIQERINQAMAKKIEETIRTISSDPAVARMVQDRMMVPRMAASPLRQDMQPFMMSKLVTDPGTINVTNNNAGNADTPLATTRCSTTDSRFPNC